MDKNFKIIGLRPSLIGDIITSLPVLTYLEKKSPNSYKTVSVAKKCAQCVPLLLNQPLIDRIHINEILERPNDEDKNFFESHNLIIPPDLQHPTPHWHNSFHMVEENFEMMGFKDWNILSYEERTPKLNKWFDLPERENKCIAIWGFAGYSRPDGKCRAPNVEYWNELIFKLQDAGYRIMQFGSEKDPDLNESSWKVVWRCNDSDFFTQVKQTLACDLMIGTDSGSSLVMGAYGFPQITLLTNWNKNHNQNFFSLAPRNKNNFNLFAPDGCDNISQEQILETIKLF